MKTFRLLLIALTMSVLVTTCTVDGFCSELDDLQSELESLERYYDDVIDAVIYLMQINVDGSYDTIILELLHESGRIQDEIDNVRYEIDSYQTDDVYDTILRGRRLGQVPGRG